MAIGPQHQARSIALCIQKPGPSGGGRNHRPIMWVARSLSGGGATNWFVLHRGAITRGLTGMEDGLGGGGRGGGLNPLGAKEILWHPKCNFEDMPPRC